ncbi:MAG: hypothetical protein LBV80_11845 [Deltaproteobacteria bacterium]|jgi:hypothetical protein|nr:hypothetical protein [Deltaproteobacteria bacterium]
MDISGERTGQSFEEFTLQGYQGGDFCFRGRLFSEGSFFDEESRALIRLRLFALPDNRLVYSVVSGSGEQKDRRVYVLKVENDVCHIDNGSQNLTLPLEMLFSAVFGLCGLADGRENELRAAMEESLNVVVA